MHRFRLLLLLGFFFAAFGCFWFYFSFIEWNAFSHAIMPYRAVTRCSAVCHSRNYVVNVLLPFSIFRYLKSFTHSMALDEEISSLNGCTAHIKHLFPLFSIDVTLQSIHSILHRTFLGHTLKRPRTKQTHTHTKKNRESTTTKIERYLMVGADI